MPTYTMVAAQRCRTVCIMHRQRAFRGAAIIAVCCALSLGALAAFAAAPASTDWAFPGAGPSAPTNPATVKSLRGSTAHYTQAQIDSGFLAIDWWPKTHPPLPQIVRAGDPPHVFACGYCHLPDGHGRPENAALAGLPAAYIEEQAKAMRDGTRKSIDQSWPPIAGMMEIAHNVRSADVASAAAYFSKRPYVERTRVVESRLIPRVAQVAFAYKRLPGNGRELLGARIVETPVDFTRFMLRDSTVHYIAYVPPGALARGNAIAAGKRGAPECVDCHGTGLRGSDIAPPIAGRPATELFRQLVSFKRGTRQVSVMQSEVSSLQTSDFIDLAAYVASLKP
jgi:cytochrome c553